MELITITASTIMSLFMNISGTYDCDNRFAYNAEMQDGKVSAIITYDNTGKYLSAKTRQTFTYDDNDRLVKKEIMKWDEGKQEWTKHICMNYTYDADNTVLDMLVWRNNEGSYVQSQRMTYSAITGNATGVSLYSWNSGSKTYKLKDNYVIFNGHTDNLLAGIK